MDKQQFIQQYVNDSLARTFFQMITEGAAASAAAEWEAKRAAEAEAKLAEAQKSAD